MWILRTPEERFQALAPDLVGFGHSDEPAASEDSTSARAVIEFMRANPRTF